MRTMRRAGCWWLKDGTLYRSIDGVREAVVRVFEGDARIGALVRPIDPHTVLLSFEGDGRLLRWDGAALSTVLEFPDRRAFVRQSGVAVASNGSVWVGEYGVFPGARCARVYRSGDRGRTFEFVEYLRAAKHIHLVHELREHGLILTTGDLASERRMYLASSTAGRFRTLHRAWSGFTAVAETRGVVHFGTDLQQDNGFLRFDRGLTGIPEFHPLPPDCDAQVRRLIALDDERLLAWCRVEDDLVKYGEEHLGALLLSEDAGRSWSLVHRMLGKPDEVPESIELLGLDPVRILTVATSRPETLEVK